MYDIRERFKILCIETAEEYLRKKEIARKRKAMERCISAIKFEHYKKRVQAKGVCEGCGSDEMPRWVHNDEFFLCAECFLHDLQCQADVSYPSTSVQYMDEYEYEYLGWDCHWMDENGIT